MVMRVTQQSIYGSVIRNTNANLSNLMDTNVQSSSQKRINSPSDDPTGTVQVLNCRSSLSQYTQYQSNITQANSWLNQSNSALTSVSTLISSIKALAEQGATGSVTAANRDQIAASARQYFQQLISLANTKNGSDSLYAGQKTDTDAFATTLAMNSNDTAFSAAVASNGGSAVTGSSNTTVFVQFMGTDTVTHQPAFQYSTDGGSTWTNGTYSSPVPAVGKQQLQMGGVTISMSENALDKVTANTSHDDTKGTAMWIRPSATYQGNTNDDLKVFSASNSVVTGSAAGTFSGNVMVRADEGFSFAANTSFKYSYSTDGGTTWTTGNSSGLSDGSSVNLEVPGGVLNLKANGGSLASGDQYFVQPSTANVSFDISATDSVVVNGVGKDIFGGLYNGKAVTFDGSTDGNLIETVGKLVGYLETNNQQGCQEALTSLTTSQTQIVTAAASVGATINRVSAAKTMVQNLSDNTDSTMSGVEDADLTALVTKMAQQELAYSAVLKSSSMVMNLSLVSYL